MKAVINRRQALIRAATSLPLLTLGQTLALAQGAAKGTLLAARVLKDGWTIELDFAGLETMPVEPARLSLRLVPPAKDFLEVAMSGIGPRTIAGTTVNINPWYDADHRFPSPRARGPLLTVPVRLDRPVRSGETGQATLAAGFMPGVQGGQVTVVNNSALLTCFHAQDRYTAGDSSTLLAEIDCLTGCRIEDADLVRVSELPTKFDPRHPRFPNIAFDARVRRVIVGSGQNDNETRVLWGVDFRADDTGGYFALASGPRVVIRDCLFDDANIYCVSSGSSVHQSYRVLFNEMRGALEGTRGEFANLPQATRGHSAFFMRHLECESEVRLNRIHGSTNDGVIIMRGICAQNSVYSQGWDNRPSPGHADGLWAAPMTPGAPKIIMERNFVDSRDPGHGFNSITGSLTFALPPTQSHSKVQPGDTFHDGLIVRGNLMLSHRISWNMVDGISGPNVPNDRRYVRRVHVHDNWFTAPYRKVGSTPLYPWRDPNMRWSPDARWINNVDPTTGKVWVMGPQPRDMQFSLEVSPPEAKPGDTVTWVLSIDRYLAQYRPVQLRLRESGAFADSLEADVSAALAGYEGATFANGVFTFSQGLVGREVGQRNEGLRLRISRRIGASSVANGSCSLAISANSVGTIVDADASCRIVR